VHPVLKNAVRVRADITTRTGPRLQVNQHNAQQMCGAAVDEGQSVQADEQQCGISKAEVAQQ